MKSQIEQILERIKIEKLDNISVIIDGSDFTFFYTDANEIIKEEYRDEYVYFGGLQCVFGRDSFEYEELENELIRICKSILNKQ